MFDNSRMPGPKGPGPVVLRGEHMYSVTVHFRGGSAPLVETADQISDNASSLELMSRNGDYTVVPHANVLYYDVVLDDDDSEFGDDAAVFLAPRPLR
jgi:hypothetical protein